MDIGHRMKELRVHYGLTPAGSLPIVLSCLRDLSHS